MSVITTKSKTLREVRGTSLIEGVDRESKETIWFIDNGWEVSENLEEVIKDELLEIDSDSVFVAVCQAYL